MIVIASKRIEKALRKFHKGGRNDILATFQNVIDLLARNTQSSRDTLIQKFSDHALKGAMHGNRELHLDQDILLIYRKLKTPSIIELRDILTHDQLRNR